MANKVFGLLYHETIETDLFDTYYYLDGAGQSCNNSETDQFRNILLEVEIPKQSNLSSFFSKVNPKDYVSTLFPLVMTLERQNGRLKFQRLLQFFNVWKLHAGYMVGEYLTSSPRINQDNDLMCWDANIQSSIESILIVMRKFLQRNSAYVLHEISIAFNKWKSLVSVIRKLQRNVPCGFRVVALLGHSVLWNIFLQYCSDRRKIPQESRCNSSVIKLKDKSVGDLDFPLYHSSHKYNKKLLSLDRLGMFMKDCRTIPIVMGYQILQIILQASLSDISCRKRRLESIVTALSSARTSGKAFCSNTTTTDSNISTPHTSIANNVNRKQEMISFNTFLKIYWKIFGDILGVEKLSRSQIVNIRNLLCSTDENCLKQAKFLNYSGDWNKFLSSLV